MITKRIIPCLDVKDGRVVKGVNFQRLGDVASPVELAKYYSDNGADELVFYDITASAEGRALFTDILTETARTVFIPLTVGGGINTTDDFDRVLKCGADKVSVNSGAIRDPSLVGKAAKLYGDQCVVLSVDVKRVDGVFRIFAKGGRENTGMEAIEWVRRCVGEGAGEVVVNSMDTDGVKQGFDLELLGQVGERVLERGERARGELGLRRLGYDVDRRVALQEGIHAPRVVVAEHLERLHALCLQVPGDAQDVGLQYVLVEGVGHALENVARAGPGLDLERVVDVPGAVAAHIGRVLDPEPGEHGPELLVLICSVRHVAFAPLLCR